MDTQFKECACDVFVISKIPALFDRVNAACDGRAGSIIFEIV
ncbi:hypothetical protein [Helicobacter vulpis]|nr:hypothetical protein [Helicobacter vulpis]